jgi:hypothetical protein
MDFAKINHCFTTAISKLAEQEILATVESTYHRPGSKMQEFYNPSATYSTEKEAKKALSYMSNKYKKIVFHLEPFKPESAIDKMLNPNAKWKLTAENFSQDTFLKALDNAGFLRFGR